MTAGGKKIDTHHSSLAGVVASLFLGDICRMPAHGCSCNADTASLFPEHQASSAETIVRAVEVDSANVVPILDTVVQTPSLGGNAGIGNHHVKAAEIRDDLRHRGLDSIVIPDIHLIGEGFDTEVFTDGLGQGCCLLRGVVPKR